MDIQLAKISNHGNHQAEISMCRDIIANSNITKAFITHAILVILMLTLLYTLQCNYEWVYEHSTYIVRCVIYCVYRDFPISFRRNGVVPLLNQLGSYEPINCLSIIFRLKGILLSHLTLEFP